MSCSLLIQQSHVWPEAPGQADCQAWFEAALGPKVQEAEVTLKLVDKEEGAALNQQYRQKSGPTNVLSFPYEWPGQAPGSLLGDLVICVPLVSEEAQAQHKPLRAHWAHLVVHGTLHLQGYDHIEPTEALKMEALETDILQQLGFPSPYRELF